jgi:hypothetical protein
VTTPVHRATPGPDNDDDLRWFKSRYSAAGGCLEVAITSRRVHVRDSKDPHAGTLIFSWTRWATFIDAVRAGKVNG